MVTVPDLARQRGFVRFAPVLAVFDSRDSNAEALSCGRIVRPATRVQYSASLAGGAVAGLATIRSPSGFDLFLGELRSPDGRPLHAPSQSSFTVKASARGYREVTRTDVEPLVIDPSELGQEDQIPAAPVYRFDLSGVDEPPAGSGRMEIRGTIRTVPGAADPGWTVRADEEAVPNGWDVEAVTKPDGSWTLRPPGLYATSPQEINVQFRSPIDPGYRPPRTVVVRPGVPLDIGQSGVFGRCVGISGEVVMADVAVQTANQGLLSTDTDANGSWSIHFPIDWIPEWVTPIARHSDGRAVEADQIHVGEGSQVRVPDFRFL